MLAPEPLLGCPDVGLSVDLHQHTVPEGGVVHVRPAVARGLHPTSADAAGRSEPGFKSMLQLRCVVLR